jgi:hypothetical protein
MMVFGSPRVFRWFALTAVLFGAVAWIGPTARACICDEICSPGEVYSNEHEMCVDEKKTADEATENPTS